MGFLPQVLFLLEDGRILRAVEVALFQPLSADQVKPRATSTATQVPARFATYLARSPWSIPGLAPIIAFRGTHSRCDKYRHGHYSIFRKAFLRCLPGV